jgi:hypothetical protein
MQFTGTAEELLFLEEMRMDGIHIEMSQFRSRPLPLEVIAQAKHLQTQVYASNITLVKDLENAKAMAAEHCYGGLMMPPISRHQTLHINDSRIAKAIFSLHPHQHLNQNGDKK